MTRLFQFHSFLRKERINILADGYGPFCASLLSPGKLLPLHTGMPGVMYVLSNVSPVIPLESLMTGELIVSRESVHDAGELNIPGENTRHVTEKLPGQSNSQVDMEKNVLPIDLYRLCAYKAPPMIDLITGTGNIRDVLSAIRAAPGLVEEISRGFHDYNETFMFMGNRYTRDNIGVLWYDAFKKVYILYSFHDTEFTLPDGVSTVYDVSAERAVVIHDNYITIQSRHTYALQ
jgi:hypothetical protein